MCELLAMSANVPTDICFSFAGLLKRGGETGEHKDGWGIVFYEDKGVRVFKDIEPACNSKVAKMLVEYPIKSLQVIGHIRKANVGEVNLRNTHPFVRQVYSKNFCFAHNGQMPNLKPKKLSFYFPVGETDSEYAFCDLLAEMIKQLSESEIENHQFWDLFFQYSKEISKLGVFNAIIGNGEQLGAFCDDKLSHITRRAPFGLASLLDDDFQINFKEHTTENDVVSVIATHPLTSNEQWVIMKPKSMVVFEKGELVDQKEG